MRSIITSLALLGIATAVAGAPQYVPPPPDAPLVEDKGIKVDALDVEAAMLRIPPEKRGDFRTNYDRVAGIVDNVFVTRTFAQRARAEGLDKDPLVMRRVQQIQEDFLANEYLKNLQKEALSANLEQRARELYIADKDRYVAPETVHVQHILIGPKWRTHEMAKARADEALAKIKAGEDFLAVAAAYSDDPEKAVNKGDLGFKQPAGFVPPVRDAIAKMTRKGEVSEPIESEYGYHIIKFLQREPPKLVPFEAVQKGLVANERERVLKMKIDAAITEVRSSPTAVAHRENVEALVVPIDEAAMKRAIENQEALIKQHEALIKREEPGGK